MKKNNFNISPKITSYLNTTKILSILFFSLLLGNSCKKYLDEKPNNALSNPSTLADLQALLDYSPTMNLTRTPSFGEASCGDAFIPPASIASYPTSLQQVYSWQFYNYTFVNDWAAAYEPVYIANLCNEGVEKIEHTNQNSDEWNNVKGSALFYRAYYFSQLCWTFAKAYDVATANSDLGIALRVNSDFNIPSTRANVLDSYNKIIADAKESLVYLPETASHPLRLSKAASYGLLARTYLSMRVYDSAFKYADLCLQIKNDLKDFKVADPGNYDPTAGAPFAKYNKETIFYSDLNGTLSATYSAGFVDTTLIISYKMGDLRKDQYFRPAGSYFRFKGNYTGAGKLFSGIATDEIYLIRAES